MTFLRQALDDQDSTPCGKCSSCIGQLLISEEIDSNLAHLAGAFYPEAGFSVGNAMGRNKYIYCLADSSLVIHSGKKGGTLNGAEENLRRGWVPLWVKQTEDKKAANADLVAKGGHWVEAEAQGINLADLMNAEAPQKQETGQTGDLFSLSTQPELFPEPEPMSEQEAHQEIEESVAVSDNSLDFFQLFVDELRRIATTALTVDELVEQTGLHKTQINAWLKRAVDDGLVQKKNRPVRYQIIVSTVDS